MIRVLSGDDDFATEERLREIRESVGPDEVRAPNTTTFDGDAASPNEVIGAASAVPFLAEQRLVIVKGLLGSLESGSRRRRSSDWSGLAEALKALPPTTELVFVEGPLKKGGLGLRTVGRDAVVEKFDRKRGRDLEAWIGRRFAAEGATAAPDAISRLAELIGGDSRQLASEVEKLALYCRGRTVSRSDVDTLVSPAREANIFAAVDAVLERRAAVAFRLLHQLLEEGNSVQYILTMLERQIRLVLIAQDLRLAGVPADAAARRLGMRAESFPFRKTSEQARRFDFAFLSTTLHRLLEADLAFKSGADERLGIELLVARLATER